MTGKTPFQNGEAAMKWNTFGYAFRFITPLMGAAILGLSLYIWEAEKQARTDMLSRVDKMSRHITGMREQVSNQSILLNVMSTDVKANEIRLENYRERIRRLELDSAGRNNPRTDNEGN